MADQQTPLTWLLRKRVSDAAWSEWIVCGRADFEAIKKQPLNWGMEYEAVAVVALPDGVATVPAPQRYDFFDTDLGGDIRKRDNGDWVKWEDVAHLFATCGVAGTSEVDRLRAEQASGVMLQIGPLLDAWDGMDNDTKAVLREEAPDLVKALVAIGRAMDGTAGVAPTDGGKNG